MSDVTDRLLRRKEVEAVTGLSTTSIYKYMNAGIFPRPVKFATGAVRWRLSAVQAWIAAQEPAAA